jgi:hypothetical protein
MIRMIQRIDTKSPFQSLVLKGNDARPWTGTDSSA